MYISIYIREVDMGDLTATGKHRGWTQLDQGRNNRGKEVKSRYRYYDSLKCNQRHHSYRLLSRCGEPMPNNLFTFQHVRRKVRPSF